MRNLYFKIFIWFWLAMTLVGTAFVISTVTLQDSSGDIAVASGLTLTAESVIEAYEDGGREGLANYLGRIERRFRLNTFLFDDNAQELSGRVVPDGGVELVERAGSNDELVIETVEGGRLIALQVVSPEGNTYVVLTEMEWPYRGWRRPGADGRRGAERLEDGDARERLNFRGGRGSRLQDGTVGPPTSLAAWRVWSSLVDQPGELVLRLLAVFFTAGILCFGLARYLTAPVLRLRDATHQFASGNLGVRVGPAVGKRRDELAELGRDFDVMAERIESLLTTQRQLMSDVSHELRSPLARLNVALALARQRSGEEIAGPLDRIEVEAEQLNALIGRVLSLSSFESGASEPEFASVNLNRLIGDVTADADFEAKAKDAGVKVKASEPCSVRGNELLLRSAIENVVRNAVLYTDSGTDVEIMLTFSGMVVDDSSGDKATSRCAVVSVRDHGPGVSDDQLAHLFEPFYRIADSRDRESGGTGLGLAITERAVRLHGGTVGARNATDGGLIVEIRLPIDGV
jgi:two-component system sensor histidine kinase CpxA